MQIEEDAGEELEVEPEDLLRDGHQERDGGTGDGGEGVGDEEGQRAPAVVPVQRGDGVGVEPVGEVVMAGICLGLYRVSGAAAGCKLTARLWSISVKRPAVWAPPSRCRCR